MSGMRQIVECARGIYRNEGFLSFYNGLTPRLMRVAPGQAITFMVYEKIRILMAKYKVNGPLEVDPE
jgi:solute carrier family 25 citrate transporter 1